MTTRLDYPAYVQAMVLQSDGKIVVVGYLNDTIDTVSYCIVLVRYNTDGSLDTGFGSGGHGWEITNVTKSGHYVDAYAYAVAIDGAGNFIVAGSISNGTNQDFAVLRYTSAGLLDINFNAGGSFPGSQTTDFGNGNDVAYAVAIDSSGNLVLAGHSYNGANNDFALVRYTSAGVLDTGFNTTGKVTTAIGSGNDYIRALNIDSNGKIVVAGYSYNGTNNDVTLARYTSAGVLDTGFNTTGKVTTAIGSGNDEAYAAAIDASDNIVVTGLTHNGSNNDLTLLRYTSAGVLDTTFNTTGKVTTAIGSGNDEAYGVAIDASGKLVVAGMTYNGTNNDFALARYLTDGSLDATFGANANGKVSTELNARYVSIWNALKVDGNGKTVVAGYVTNGTDTDFIIARYTANGILDTSFGTNSSGYAVTDFGGDDTATALIIDGNNKILVAGYTILGGNSNFALARYSSSGGLDATFGTNGKVTTAIGASGSEAHAIALDSNGKIYLSGTVTVGSDLDFVTARYTSSGVLDNTFGTNGSFIHDFNGYGDIAYAIVVDSSNRPIVAGYSYFDISGGQDANFTIARYTTGGALDATFGTNGVTSVDFGHNYTDYAYGLALDAGGKILVTGFATTGANTADFGLARLTSSGVLDTAFGTNGKVSATIGTDENYGHALVADANGNIIVAGSAGSNASIDIALTRFTSGGVLDTTFGTGGKVTTVVNSTYSAAGAMGIDSTGRLIVSGNAGYAGVLLAYQQKAAPSATTNNAGSVGANSATLNATVNDNWAATTVSFEYGASTSYGTVTPAGTGGTINADAGSTAVSLSVSGLTCGATYHFRVKAVNIEGTVYGSDKTFATSSCPQAPAPTPPPPPPPPTTVDNSTTPVEASPGSTLNVTSGTSGATIELPKPPATGETTSAVNIVIDGGSLSVKPTESGSVVKTASVKVDGKDTTVLNVTAGTAEVKASAANQPLVSVGTGANAVVISSGSANATVITSVDKTTGVTSLTLPKSTTGVEADASVKMTIGGQDVNVKPSGGGDVVVTLATVTVNGVSTQVVSVTGGSATVTSSQPNQPLLAVGGGSGSKAIVVTADTAGTAATSTVNVGTGETFIAVSNGVVTLPTNAFAEAGNGFAAIKDGKIYAGEIAVLNSAGKITGVRLGSQSGAAASVGDPIKVVGAAGLTMNVTAIYLKGKVARISDTQDFGDVIAASLGAGFTSKGQNASGVLTLAFPGGSANALPTGEISVDTSRADGMSVIGNGKVEVVKNGVIARFVPTVADPTQLAGQVVALDKKATVTVSDYGLLQTTVSGITYALQPAWVVSKASGSATGFTTDAEGHVVYQDGTGNQQLLYLAFADLAQLVAAFKSLDAHTDATGNDDGTVTARLLGKSYTLTPEYALIQVPAEHAKDAWWLGADGKKVYVRGGDGKTAQGFNVK